MTILVSAVITVLAAQTALAEQRTNKPFTTINGRTSTAAPAAPGGGAAANTPLTGQAPAMTAAMINGAPSDGGRAFIGGGRQVASRSSPGRAVRRGGTTFWGGGGRKVDGGDTTTGTEEAPPNFSKPGALIRTTGQLPKYEKAEAPRTHTVDAGEIVMNKRKAVDVARAPSLQQGPGNTPPPPNPVAGGAGYSGGAVANTGGSDGGHDNNGSGNNGKGKGGDDEDEKGNAKKNSIDKDPTGFNDAY